MKGLEEFLSVHEHMKENKILDWEKKILHRNFKTMNF